MNVHLDTSMLVEAFAGSRPAFARVVDVANEGHRFAISSIALYEWLRGPRTAAEIDVQAAIAPPDAIHVFGEAEAALAAELYTTVKRPRGREFDLAIAACAIVRDAALWTANRRDFEDIPGLRLI